MQFCNALTVFVATRINVGRLCIIKRQFSQAPAARTVGRNSAFIHSLPITRRASILFYHSARPLFDPNVCTSLRPINTEQIELCGQFALHHVV